MTDLPAGTFEYELDYSNIDPSSQPPPPPSSVHGEIDEDDNHIPVDDSFHHRDENYDSTNNEDVHQNTSEMNNLIGGMAAEESLISIQNDQLQSQILPSPQQPELTLKEKLVLRERQQRIETERARLKRQFALSSTAEETDLVNESDGTMNYNQDVVNHPSAGSLLGGIDHTNDNGREFEEESTRAHPDEEEAAADEANRRLGFNMERFLRNSESFHPELQHALETDRNFQSGESATDATKGVVMERFLNDIVNTNHMLPDVPSDQIVEPHRSVSFDVDAAMTTQDLPHSVLSQSLEFQHQSLLASIHPSFGEESAAGISLVSNASMRTEANTVRDDFYAAGNPPLYSTSSLENMHENDRASLDDVSSRVSDDEPRVLRLTEADMLEMAAIEEASIGNAPPSDRDEVESYSEIGELTDFGGSGGGMHRFLVGDPGFTGPDTPTTALESTSQLSQRSAHRGGTSAMSSSTTNEHTDVDMFTGHLDLISASEPAHYFVASASASVAANPPSEGGRDDDDETMENESHMNDADIVARTDNSAGILPFSFSVNEVPSSFANVPSSDLGSENAGTTDVLPIANRLRQYNPNDSSVDGSRIENTEQGNVLDDFDFDKDEPLSPFNPRPVRGVLGNDDSFRNLPNDPWSSPDHMHISPLQVGVVRGRPTVVVEESTVVPDQYEKTDRSNDTQPRLMPVTQHHCYNQSETTPLLRTDAPHLPQPKTDLLGKASETTFNTVGSGPFHDEKLVSKNLEEVRKSSVLGSAIPERQIALLLTLALEIPVLFLIMGGSDSLCGIVGRGRYQLILGFLPLICAISGTAAMQSREVTIQSIAGSNATSAVIPAWFVTEIATTARHSIVMGIALGFVAYIVSGLDIVFGITILVVQLASILCAALTGTIVPLLCSTSLIKQQAGQWSLLFVTAFQDIVGSLASIRLSYYIIVLLSAKKTEYGDTCLV